MEESKKATNQFTFLLDELQTRIQEYGLDIPRHLVPEIRADERASLEAFVDKVFVLVSQCDSQANPADEDSYTIELTTLKHLMHLANLHNYNPALFKVINDLAINSDY